MKLTDNDLSTMETLKIQANAVTLLEGVSYCGFHESQWLALLYQELFVILENKMEIFSVFEETK